GYEVDPRGWWSTRSHSSRLLSTKTVHQVTTSGHNRLGLNKKVWAKTFAATNKNGCPSRLLDALSRLFRGEPEWKGLPPSKSEIASSRDLSVPPTANISS